MKPVIYQLLVRLFGNKEVLPEFFGTKEANGCGKFADINEKALKSLRDFGITHIWYTGIVEHAVATDYSGYGIKNDYPEIVKGRAGSPYAIKDYYDVNPDLATDVVRRIEEFKDLVGMTHAAGMKVVIDFVPNHLARVYKSDVKHELNGGDFGENDNPGTGFSADNDFYYLPGEALQLPEELAPKAILTEFRTNPEPYREFPARATGNDCFSSTPGINDWYETVKVNYGVDYFNDKQIKLKYVPPLWKKMRSVVFYWAEMKIDGFRVDMAEMVPLEFWEWLIPQIKLKYPEIIFIAEIYQADLYKGYIERGHFDYLYDKIGFYEAVRNVIEEKSDTRAITRNWQQIGSLEKYMLRFLENHDEQRIASGYFAADPWKAIPGMVLAATMNNGPVLLYFGQEVGEPAEGISGFSGDDGRTSIFDYWNVPNHQKWMSNGNFDGSMLTENLAILRTNYEGIIRICNEYELFSNGSFYDLMWVNDDLHNQSSGRLYAYLRYYEESIALIILNFGYNNFNRLQLFIPDEALDIMQVSADIKIKQQYVFPFGKGVNNNSCISREDKFVFDIAPLSALVFVFVKV